MIHHISVDLKLTNAGAPYEAPFDAWLALELQRLSSCTLSSGRLWFVYWAIRRFTDNLFSLGHAWLSLWSKNMITGRINQFTWMFELPPFGHLVSIIKCCSRLVGGGTRDRLRIVFCKSQLLFLSHLCLRFNAHQWQSLLYAMLHNVYAFWKDEVEGTCDSK
jgi:hypothetical protein